ncbi:MAG: hypothetical protein ACI31V_06400 [Bacilli bacterium]
MVYSYQEILEKLGSRTNIEKALESGKLFRLKNGVYSESDIVNPIVVISKKYKGAIITMDSAFYYYNLTDVIPQKVHVATNRNARKINDEEVVQYYVNSNILNQGKTQHNINGNMVNIYDKERLLIELIRKRASIPFDYYKEIIENYRQISNKLDIYKIEEYVSLFKNDVNLFNILQREVF